MASLCYLLLAMWAVGSLISPAQSDGCSSQKFGKRVFDHCDDLPHLDAQIHWTHNSANSSLSVAFLASPPKSGGWVAWAINPTATGMAGAQAFLALLAGTAPTVRTLNISSYSSIVPSPKLAFEFWDLTAEHSDGKFTIFVSVKVPPKSKSVNHIWQVGPSVSTTTGAPAVHEFKSENLKAKGVLEFVRSGGGPSPSPGGDSPGSAPAPDAGAGGGGKNGGESRMRRGNLRSYVGMIALIWGVVIFWI